MPRAHKETSHSSRSKKTSATKTSSPMRRLADLRSQMKSNTTAHIRADNTTEQYSQVIQRVRKWLEEFLKVEESAEGCLEDEDEDVPVRNEHMASEFHGCLDGKPNQFTPEAIAMYISWKCYEEGRKLSTGESVHAAFKYYYTHLEGDKYRGDWRYDEGNKRWIGNPCNAAEVVDLMEGCKRKDRESERHHSKPASIIIMERLYAHSISVCPDDYPVLDAKSLAFKILHLRFHAYSSLGFTIWTRNTETSHLQAKHVDRNPLPRPGATPSDPPFIQINLRDRKNWQKKQAKNETQLNGNRYNLYPQKIHAICAQTHLSIWMEFCEEHILRQQYEPDDYIFPTINANGVTFQSKQPITPEAVQKMIDNFTVAAGVPGAFTTHCFRHGGAQYRFMFAPIGEHWTLARIRWWGGWAPNEKCDTLIRYLLDELNTYEEDHSDALAPIDRRASESHAGEAAEMGLLSAAEGRQLFTMVGSTIKKEFAAIYTARLPQGPAPYSPYPYQGYIIWPSPPLPKSSFIPSPSSYLSQMAAPAPNQAIYASTASSAPQPSTKILPELDYRPIIPKIRPSPSAWKQVIIDWEHPDPSRDHHYALKDWKPEWAKVTQQAALYGQRKLIALEFIERFKRDDLAFQQANDHYTGIETGERC
ncbi:hypothetical protein EV368DRAFT_90008 [Lentinula lateritia]|nr:hypothetical protein EV368DRAFT_90008 [Lentinula lateritia]